MTRKIALYPGTFDPLTYGHLDVIKRAIKIVDTLYVGIAHNKNKKTLFNIKEREEIISKTLKSLPKQSRKKIKTVNFNGLTINFCKKINANILIRGLRVVADFEYEFQLAGMNKKLNSKIETMFLMSDVENQIISSKFVKEIASLGGDINRFVTKYVVKMLKNKH